jgi:two-component system response regulator FixJ
MHLLVIEDDYVTAQNISAILACDVGAVVEIANRGEEGLERATRQAYDLIVLDLSLPDIHGLVILKALRAVNSHTPVLIVSGDTSSYVRAACLERGADDYLTKPFAARELMARVRAIGRRTGDHTKLMHEASEANSQVMSLTERERDVLHQIAVGRSNKSTAHFLGLSPRTVEVHRAHIMKKLKASCFADVVRIQSAAARMTGNTMSVRFTDVS